ncbi:MAG: hypothetical protein OSB11_07960, partial [Gammaproteobacteria bacterium]|nr:hypothetical protein [Gammaproteobacteria bacterium]
MSSMQRIQLLLFLMPVVLAHYYSLDRSLISVLSALASVSLIVLTSTALVSCIKNSTARNIIGLVLIYLLSFYYASQFISYYLQGSYFNQQYL